MKGFSYYYKNKFFWLRLFGYGLTGKSIKRYDLIFSERNNRSKGLTILNWRFRILKPNSN